MMLDAIASLSNVGFVLFVLAVLFSLIQLALLAALALRGATIATWWGFVAAGLWVALWFVR